MKRGTLWTIFGERPSKARRTIEFEAAQIVVTPKRPPGRPRLNPPGKRFTGWKMLTARGYPMICRREGCGKRLRKNDVLVCSGYCREEVEYLCRSLLDALAGQLPLSDFPMRLRARYVRKKRARPRENRRT